MAYKIIGALILFLSGLWVARLLNARAMAAFCQSEGILSLLRTVKLRVDCYAEALPEILSSLSPKILHDCGYRGEDLPRDFDQLLAGCTVLDEESMSALREFASEFGRGYRDEQVRACAYSISRVETRREALARALPMEKKRNTTLCLALSLGAAILLF